MNNLSVVESVFFAALEKGTPQERAAYLDAACGPDQELRQHVERLLLAHPKVGSFLQAPASALPGTVDEPTLTERPGTVVGPYRLMEQIGEGGFGLVFVAEQQQPVRRKVALKVIKPGMDTREVIARFEAERQALALMDHPHIAKVLDASTTESGRPYFAMELVKGIPITDYCDQNQLTPRERLGLFVSVCQAVQHAHTKGVIHRDLKPSNVLVTLHDGTPVVKVIDFGVAKAIGQRLTEKTIYTRFAQLIGTPLYMSPEQAEMSGLDIDTRSDIYSLGVLLYELLTGTTPFDQERLRKAGFDEVRRIIREEEPPKPSTRLSTLGETLSAVSAKRKTEPRKLPALVRGELDWIVMKALEKDRTRRYETANGLARDVQRYLHDEPVEACPPSTGYKLRKFARKHKKAFATTAAFVVLLAGAALVSTALAVWAMRAEADAVRARNEEAVRREEADEQKHRAEAVLTFFQEKVLSAGRLRRDGGGLGDLSVFGAGRDVTVRQAIDVASAEIATAFPSQPLMEASIRDVLGTTFHRLGEFALAIQQHERVLALRQAQLGVEHLDTLATMHVLAQEHIEAGNLDRGFLLAEETLKRRKATLGPSHIETSRSMFMLAQAYYAAGKPDQALPLVEETFAWRKAALGPTHSRTLSAMGLVVELYMKMQQYPEALRLGQELLSLRRHELPADDPVLAGTLSTVGQCLLHARQPAEAEPLLRECLAIRQKKQADHWMTFQAQSLLGDSLLAQQRYAEAEPLLRQGYEGLKQGEAKIPWYRKVELTESLERLVRLYDATGQKDLADQWRKQLEETKAAIKPPTRP
jgi:serine/threonine protein kinase/tetratricopeptide (TPR) repeat protein